MSRPNRLGCWIECAERAGLHPLVRTAAALLGDTAVRALLVGLGRGERGSTERIIDAGLVAMDARNATWREMMRGARVLRAAAALGGLENQGLACGRVPAGC